LVTISLVLCGCPDKKQPDPGAGETPKTGPETPKKTDDTGDPATADIPLDESKPDDPARLPKAPEKVDNRAAARYILVAYRGAQKAPETPRSKEMAQRRAAHLVKAARKKDADFVELARKYSDAPEEERGMQVIFGKGEMAPTFETAAFGMGPGQVSDAVETPFGFYVIMRATPEEYSTAHIVVQYKGAKMAPPGVKRTKKEARARAENVQKRAVKPDANFAVLAERYSDSPSKMRGGVIRPLVSGQESEDYENYLAAVSTLKVGEVSGVVETPFGFHVIKRLKLERIRASHILIAYTDSEGTPKEKRTKWDAEALAKKIHGKLKKEKDLAAKFPEYAKKYSECNSAAKGGDLGLFARGQMVPRFEQMAFGLKVGRMSDVIHTKFGYHIIMRTE
jgi:parvulin-like peptidyl-prolyl isomerase